MRYVLTAGRVLSEGGFIALGTVLDLSDNEAARYRLGGCALEPVTVVAEADAKPSPAANGADTDSPRPTRKPRRRSTRSK